MLQETQANEVFTIRGHEPRPFSIRNIIGDSINPIKPWVVAIGTSGGKTFTTAAKLEFLFKYGYLKNTDRVLIFAADKTILRGNFTEQFSFFFKDVPASFSWREVTNSKELKQSINDGVQVIIMLPQTVTHRALQLLKTVKWVWFVQDEAHRWYFKNHITKILNQIKPTYQFLLTGTPFKFNLRKDKFQIDYTPVRDMYEMGYLSDVTAQVLHSSVELNQIDYVSLLGNVKESKHLTNSEIEETLMIVLQQMIKKLKLPLKGYKSIHNVSKNALSVFGKLQKTIIFTHGTSEADVVGKYLNDLGIKTLISHSNIKGENPNDTFESFRSDIEVKILVAVNRGKEGFDFSELYNVIDMTYSQNFEVVMQIFGRVLRKNKEIPMKYFFKVAPKNTSGYFVDWMNAMFMLFDNEWYSKFNGKNGFDIRIPNALIQGKQKTKSTTKSNNTQKGQLKPRNIEFFNSLEFMKENGYFKLDDKLSTVASTTLRDVAHLHDISSYSGVKREWRSYEDAKKYISSLNFKSFKEYEIWSKSKDRPFDIPASPYLYKNNGFISLADYIGSGVEAVSKRKFMSYQEAKQYMLDNNIKNAKEFRNLGKNRPSNIPSNPNYEYSKTNEWNGWDDFFSKTKKQVQINTKKSTTQNMKPIAIDVYRWDKNTKSVGKFIKSFNSMKAANKELGTTSAGIKNVLRKIHNHCIGYYIEYAK
jgi:superfamily II DNA/RNA helicase